MATDVLWNACKNQSAVIECTVFDLALLEQLSSKNQIFETIRANHAFRAREIERSKPIPAQPAASRSLSLSKPPLILK